MPFTEHRWHSHGSAVVRLDEERTYFARHCPGDAGVHPRSNNPFPTIRTLLSIPFSLLHTVPRLSAIVPRSRYQHELIAMGKEIIFLWSWDPSPLEVEQLTIRTAQNRTRTPQPISIHDRQNITFNAMRPHVTFGPATGVHRADHSAKSIPDRTTFELASGKVSISVIPHLSWGSGDGLQLSDGDGEQLDKEADLTHENIATSLEVFSETMSASSNESHEWQDPEQKTRDQCWSPTDIVDWSNMIINDKEKMSSTVPPLIPPTSFEKGIIGGMSTNDFLMIKGLIDPGLYVRYMHPELFSQD
jgi:hypothetical protein